MTGTAKKQDMIEAEYKLRVREQQLGRLENRIGELGFQAGKKLLEEDTYYDNAAGQIRGQDGALRIRQNRNLLTGESYAEVNYKGARLDPVSMTRTELECRTEDPLVLEQILGQLGFHPCGVRVVKERQEYRREDVTLCLDRVRGLGTFLEAEILTEEEKREEAVGRLGKLLEELGCSMTDNLRISYLGMLMKQAEEDKENN